MESFWRGLAGHLMSRLKPYVVITFTRNRQNPVQACRMWCGIEFKLEGKMLKRKCLIATPRRDLREPRRVARFSVFFRASRRSLRGVATIIAVMFTACTGSESKTEVPDHILEMENVTIFSEEDFENPNTIRLIKDREFADSDDLYFANIRGFITDDSGRVYIKDIAPGTLTIHVFSPDGDYIASLGRKGRGPGEYNSLCCLNVRSNVLYVVDKALSRVTTYSTDSLELLETLSIDQNNLNSAGQLSGKRFRDHYFIDDETRLLSFIRPQRYTEETPATFHYFIADSAYQKIGDEVFKQVDMLETWGDWNGHMIMQKFPFLKKPLITVTPSGRIFIADSDEFFIRELNKEGDVIGGFYYPVPRIPVTREDARNSSDSMSKDIAEKVELPDSWAVMQSMWSDDSERLWIPAFTEAEDELEWWVVEADGELIGKFRWPGNREAPPYTHGSTYTRIQGDYFYTREVDEETGLQTVVRYRIEIGDQDA
ncbi:MAG: 6-bladed beta-propeller [Balneolaceae bacterium]|nr:MAG: 6-bladed beta-propeller [Balneolaceae bacterium]